MKIINGKLIILHCSATTSRADIDVETIRKWHTSEPRNWSDVGYHFVIKTDGTIQNGRPLSRAGAHARKHNHNIGVCYVGGVNDDGKPEDNMTEKQEAAFIQLVSYLRLILGKPYEIAGHNEFSNKACPSFNVKTKFKHLIL